MCCVAVLHYLPNVYLTSYIWLHRKRWLVDAKTDFLLYGISFAIGQVWREARLKETRRQIVCVVNVVVDRLALFTGCVLDSYELTFRRLVHIVFISQHLLCLINQADFTPRDLQDSSLLLTAIGCKERKLLWRLDDLVCG